MRGVHELQLLPGEKEEQRRCRRGQRRNRHRQREIMHGSLALGSLSPALVTWSLPGGSVAFPSSRPSSHSL